ncbi:hypothetical protein N9033_00250 [bacterium]|nr:hypothetical protein [bacterium]
MCGVFGSRKFGVYEKLYLENKKRGNFAGGSVYTGGTGSMHIQKWEGEKDSGEMTGEWAMQESYNLFLGHTQAPTGSGRDYKCKTTHPFEHGCWLVAHNGVLENDNDIRENGLITSTGFYSGSVYCSKETSVDSAVIPALVDSYDGYDGHDVSAISKAMNNLKGTFGCWLYSKHTNQTYLTRSGSTLFANIDTGDFSSTYIPGICETSLSEGVIYCITMEGLAEVGNFDTHSPFFIF